MLRDEHRLILEVVTALERELDRDPPAAPDPVRLERCVRFFRLFADACHHGEEEGVLFPALEERGLPRDSGPVAVMLAEHREGRRLVGIMHDALPRVRNRDSGAMGHFRRAGRDYAALMYGHIGKEDGALCQMADTLIDAPACAQVCADYDRVCNSKFEGCTKAELEELARAILAEG